MKRIFRRRSTLIISTIFTCLLTLSLAGSILAQPEKTIDPLPVNENDLLQQPPDNGALQFNGLDQYVTFGPAPHLGADTFTLELWFKWDGSGSTTHTGVDGVVAYPLLTKGRVEGDHSARDMNYFLGIRGTDKVLVADLEEGAEGVTPGQNHPITGVTPIVEGEWNHAAVTFDGYQWQMFLNGMFEAEIVVDQPIRSDSIQHAALATALNSKGEPAGYFGGAIDEVRIWDKALSEQEIRNNINAELVDPQPHLLARWGLDEEAGTIVVDSVSPAVAETAVTNSNTRVPGAPFNIVPNDAPSLPVLVQPADSAVNVSTSPTLEVTVTDPEAENMTVTFYGRPLASSNSDFTLIAMPDTQKYATQFSPIFAAQTQWIVDNKDALNIAHVMQLGDCVDNGDIVAEWEFADAAFSLIENPATTGLSDGIPYSITVGNHDQDPVGDPNGSSTALYNQYFGSARFSGRNYYGGYYGTNFDNHYELFSAGGMDFIIISIEFSGASTAVLDWADNLLATYSSRRAIVISHYIMNTGNQGSWGGDGQAIYNALKDRPNLFLMHSGHRSGEGQRVDTFNGNTVNTIVADYQSRTNGGDGWMRILEFSPNNNEVSVKTYSPTLNAYETDSNSQFTFSYDMQGAVPFEVIGQVSGVTSGSNASMIWSGLEKSTEYEWYVEVDDGSGTTNGSHWSFTTGSEQPPTAAFSGSPSSGPAPLTVNFSNLTTGDYDTCTWTFGDTSSSTNCNDPAHTYNTPGTYSVMLSVDGPQGSDSTTKTNYIQVGNPASAAFTANPTTGVAPQLVTFTNNTSGDYSTCAWNFGDGGTGTSCGPTVNHTYSTGGVFTVSLTVNGIGGESTVTKAGHITISEKPTANFSGTPTSGPAPLTVNFSNLTTGDYTSCTWTFGNGNTSNVCNGQSNTYNTPGLYSVTLSVNGSGGAHSTTKTNYIQVGNPATAAFTANPTTGVAPKQVTFTNTTSGDYSTCAWNFGDGGTGTSCGPTVNHTYTTGGVFTVSLTVNGIGGESTVTKAGHITISEKPTANFSGTPTSGPAPLTVNFSNLTTGDYTSCTWTFGNGNTSNVCNGQSNTYNTPGLYSVTLSVNGSGGAHSTTKTNYIQVGNPASAAFTANPTTGIAPQLVTFTNSTSGDYSTCAWNFGDGGTSTSCGPTVNHTYTTGGVFTVSLTVNGIGGESTVTKTGHITISEVTTADFSASPTIGPAPLVVQFTNLSTGDFDTCTWTFGDGVGSSNCVNPSHEYTTAGTYEVSLTVSGPGGQATTSKTNYIVAAVPVTADFSGGPTGGITPLQVAFSNLATGDYNTCLWDFGDNSTSTDCVNPEHIYTTAGSYTVSLTVSGPGGSQTATKPSFVIVNEAGNANFSANPRQGISPLTVNFTNLSLGSFDSCLWDFGDGNTTQNCNDPAHTYTTSGTYSVSLAIDGAGGPDSVTYTNLISVHRPVSADFEGTPREGIGQLSVRFTNLSSGDYLTCLWDFGDGSSISQCNDPSHFYAKAGTYTVSLKVEGAGGTDTKTMAGYVKVTEATLSFSATPRTGKAPLLVTFNNLSTGSFDTCLWKFGDGGTSSDCDNPQHTYTSPGKYTVELVLNGPAGSGSVKEIDYINVEPQLMLLPVIWRN